MRPHLRPRPVALPPVGSRPVATHPVVRPQVARLHLLPMRRALWQQDIDKDGTDVPGIGEVVLNWMSSMR